MYGEGRGGCVLGLCCGGFGIGVLCSVCVVCECTGACVHYETEQGIRCPPLRSLPYCVRHGLLLNWMHRILALLAGK